MAMILQELCTNSLKHGALSEGGTVRVHWTTDPCPEGLSLWLRWHEQGVQPHPAAREGTGVGLGLVSGFARSDLRGDVVIKHTQDTWTVELRALLSRPLDTDRTGAGSAPYAQEACA
jgi:two-component sensor histidine kinase